MPTYEYECGAGHRYEKREGFEAPPTQRCEKCRRMARRVLHAPPILFKGSGFYVTDSRKPAPSTGSESKTEEAGTPEPAATGAGSSTKDVSTPPEADKAAAAS